MKRKSLIIKFAVMTAALMLCAAVSLVFGSARLSPGEVISGLLGTGDAVAIMRSVRLPRLLAAFLAGWGLSVSGTLLQSVTGNALAGPNIIGVNSGAGFFSILMLAFFPAAVNLTPLAAFVGALAATLVVIGISDRLGSSKHTVILGGMALGAVLNAGISLVSLLDTEVISVYNFFSIGGVSGVSANRLILPAIIIFASHIVVLVLAPRIEALCLGDSLAASLGVRVKLVRIMCIICASASAAAAVSFAGLLGFVGLMVPHMAGAIVGERFSRKILASPLIGAALVILGDVVGRVILAPTEVPVGIVMAIIGAPFFLILIFRRKRHG